VYFTSSFHFSFIFMTKHFFFCKIGNKMETQFAKLDYLYDKGKLSLTPYTICKQNTISDITLNIELLNLYSFVPMRQFFNITIEKRTIRFSNFRNNVCSKNIIKKIIGFVFYAIFLYIRSNHD